VSEDCVESLKRWGQKDRFGHLLMAHTGKIAPLDSKMVPQTFDWKPTAAAIDTSWPFGIDSFRLRRTSDHPKRKKTSWLDYDSVALAVLMIAISVLELLVLGI
jgi:hypothetical protein